jgi:hypothetical protein
VRTAQLNASSGECGIEGLARYEVHLDRKLERILAMLIRLQQLRVARVQE